MPRDASGNYTLPGAYNPVVTGTNILSSWANSTLADVGLGVTDSLDRSGRGAMLAPLKLTDGNAALPGLVFANETTSGLSRLGSGIVALSILGTEVFRWTATGLSSLTVTGATVLNGAVTLGDAAGDAVTVAGSAITWSGTPTHSGNHTYSGNLTVTGVSTFNGAVTLGDNIADTVTIGGVVHKNATGNWTIPAPNSGIHTITGIDNATTLFFTGPTRGLRLGTSGTTTTLEAVDNPITARTPLVVGGSTLALQTGAVDSLTISANRNVTIAPPSSGTALTISGFSGSQAIRISNNSGGSGIMSNRLHIGAAGTGYGAVTENGLATATGDVWNYEATDFAVQMYCNAGTIQLRTAPSGTAGNPITFTSRLSISNIGNVTIGPPSSGTALTVNGVAAGLVADIISTVTNGFNQSLRIYRASAVNNDQFFGFANGLAVDGQIGRLKNSDDLLFGFNTGAAFSEKMRIAAAGNVTIAPPGSGVALTLAGSAAVINQATLASGSTTASVYHKLSNTGGNYFVGVDNSAGSGFVTGGTAYALSLVTESAQAIQFGVFNTLAMTIGSGRNVTIEAPSSGVPLTVRGSGSTFLSNAAGTLVHVNVGRTGSEARIAVAASANDFMTGSATGDALFYHVSGARAIFGTAGAQAAEIWSNSAQRIVVGSAGNVTINAPTAGVGLTQTGFAGSDTALFNGGTSGSFRVTDRGLPYGTSLHNNAGAVTGTTNQYITSGTYTPTLFNTTNVAASGSHGSQWIRVGNVVTVSGSCNIDPTSASTSTLLGIALPIASALTSFQQLAGTAFRADYTIVGVTASVFADDTNDRATLAFFNDTNVADKTWYFTFTYQIL